MTQKLGDDSKVLNIGDEAILIRIHSIEECLRYIVREGNW